QGFGRDGRKKPKRRKKHEAAVSGCPRHGCLPVELTAEGWGMTCIEGYRYIAAPAAGFEIHASVLRGPTISGRGRSHFRGSDAIGRGTARVSQRFLFKA